ncbi:hypothetical protein HPB51_000139 [Rhipicephalus microplus]|uniref:Transposable element P transposase-like RNase H domain-containing protein n=1 Tax=Rhipicephalus microplus TaxID=6941 RepID=A0A9J6DXX7_RHIMP|nr:hypothetical protein HPB51_000139 [Rhipicephalus microplus]
MTCLLLRISSPRAYRLMSKMKLMPLPTTTRLRQMMKVMPCEFGFNKVSLDSIGAFIKNKAGVQCYGTLVLDEMKVREVVAFNKSTYKVDGFVDYGDGHDSETTADHALVVMFVPLFHSWVQPIASFATRHAAPGRVQARLFLEAILQLHKHNATVVAVISDGASTNKAMWSCFGKALQTPNEMEISRKPRLYFSSSLATISFYFGRNQHAENSKGIVEGDRHLLNRLIYFARGIANCVTAKQRISLGHLQFWNWFTAVDEKFKTCATRVQQCGITSE